jgi:heparinase II/III-like protein/uncharacterized protein DUF4962
MRAMTDRKMVERLPRQCSLVGMLVAAGVATFAFSPVASPHPRLLFDGGDIPKLKQKAATAEMKPTADRLMARAERYLTAPALVPSITKRGEPDPPGERKGIASARALQGRVLTYAMAFTLSGDRKYRDAAVRELRHAIDDWRIWVDTAHPEPYDLMTGENSLTFGLAYDWLYHDLTDTERQALREGVERRALKPYLDSLPLKRSFFTAAHNWNPVCNGGAAVLALALAGESELSEPVLKIAVPAMDHYWNHLADDGGWDEGTGYWTYGHRYAFMAAEALRRAGRPGGAERFALPGARRTGYFPIVFNPGRTLTAGFGDSNGRVNDPLLYLLGREYGNADYIWFQDRARPPALDAENWPSEALALLWRPAGAPWVPDASYKPRLTPTYVFPSIGWGFIVPSQPDPPYFLSFKNGSLAANHTHLDLNHVSVGAGDTMLLVELGSRPYPADYFSAKRYEYYEITTRGHNTVLIGGKGQVLRKAGKLLEPIVTESRYEVLTGIADGAYEVETTRVRRHVAFLDNKAWVILDEIVTPQPQPVELRFHTYGELKETAPRTWQISDGGQQLEMTSGENVTGAIETPDGWIRPVRALSLKGSDTGTDQAFITVIQPRPAGTPAQRVEIARRSDRIEVSVGAVKARWTKSPQGWQIHFADRFLR